MEQEHWNKLSDLYSNKLRILISANYYRARDEMESGIADFCMQLNLLRDSSHLSYKKYDDIDLRICIELEKCIDLIVGCAWDYSPISGNYHFNLDMKIHESLDSLYYSLDKISSEINYFWRFCGFSVFENTLTQRKEDFLKKVKYSNELDFYKEEYEKLKEDLTICGTNLFSGRKKEMSKSPINKLFNSDVFMQIQISERRKKEYILSMIEQADKSKPSTKSKPILDLSDDTQVVRIAYLEKLGVLDFLQKKFHIVDRNKLATIISSFTGMKTTSVQPHINSLLTKNQNDKNYPCSEKNVDKVERNLIRIGIDINDLKPN